MDRMKLYLAWRDYYAGKEKEDAIQIARGHISELVRRMRLMGALPGYIYHGMKKRDYQRALGMALGVQQQLLGGLTSVSRGRNLRVEGGRGQKNKWPQSGFQIRMGGVK